MQEKRALDEDGWVFRRKRKEKGERGGEEESDLVVAPPRRPNR